MLAAYANAVGASFQFDDWSVVVDESRVASLSAWWSSMPGIRPLLKLTYAIQREAGAGPVAFHGFNVAVHLANSWLLLALVSRLAPRGVALVTALVFALHPVQTEAVTYVSGRSNSLMALFALASALAWTGERRRFLSPALFAAALCVKETAAALPLALLAVSALSGDATPTRIRGTLRALLPHLAVLGVGVVAASAHPMYRHLAETSLGLRGFGVNLLTQAHAIVYLLGQLVRFDRLNADPALAVVEAWSPRVALDVAIVLGLLALGVWSLRRRPVLAFGILWFFVWLLPTNSIVPRFDVVNDRQLYLALAGPAWLLAHALTAPAARRGPRLAAAATVAIALVLGSATHLRNRVYADQIVFWEDVASKSPHNARAFGNLGWAYALAARRDDAESALLEALRLDPIYVRAGVNLRLLREGRIKPDTARTP